MAYADKTALETSLSSEFANAEVDDEVLQLPGDTPDRAWSQASGVERHRVRIIDADDSENVAAQRYLVALKTPSGWYLERKVAATIAAESDAEEALRTWATDYANRDWLRVIAMEYNSKFQSASLVAVAGTVQAPELKYFLVAPGGGSFVSMETAQRVSVA